MDDMDAVSPTLLIVEDDAAMRNILVERFRREGFTVREAADGEEGLARALADQPNAVLLDMRMPKMDGVEVVRQLRRAGRYGAGVPVVFLTNMTPTGNDLQRWFPHEMHIPYLVKTSCTLQMVVDTVREQLHRRAESVSGGGIHGLIE